MEEIWKDIEGYEKYQVSNLGNVRSLDYMHTGKVQLLRLRKRKRGYLCITLCKDGKLKNYLVHRLVAQAFLPNPDNLPQVNHRDENPSNNRANNLEWCDCKYNNNYGSHSQKISESKRGIPRSQETKRKVAEALRGIPHSEERKRKKSIPVAQYTEEGELIAIFYGAREASRQTGIYSSSINACCRGKLKTSGGFIWKYVNQ